MHRLRRSLFLLLAWALVSPATALCGPREELVPLVPGDVGLCLVVDGLRTQARALAGAGWVRRLLGTPAAQELLRSPEVRQLQSAEQELQKHLGVTWRQLRDDVLGDCVVFAFDPDPQREQGLMLLWARDAELLAALLDRVNEGQKSSGELVDLQRGTYRGVEYHRRRERGGEHFYLLHGHVFAFTGSEAMLRGVIDRRLDAAEGKAAAALADSLTRLPAHKPLATVWVNPRAFDREFQLPEGRADRSELQAVRAFLRYWRATDAVAVSLTVDPNPEVQLTLQGQPDRLPEGAVQWLREASRPSAVWDYAPADAVLTVAGRDDLVAKLQVLDGFLTAEAREGLRAGLQRSAGTALDRDFVREVLPYVGPDFGFFVADSGGDHATPHAVFAVRLQPGPDKVDESIAGSLQFFAGLAAFDHNRKHPADPIRIRTVRQGDVAVKYLEYSKFPPGVAPAFALKEGFLVAASSPEAIEQFRKRPGGRPEPVLVRLSFRHLADAIRERRSWWVSSLSEQSGGSREFSESVVDTALSALAPLESLELRQESGERQVTWALRLRLAE